MSERVTVSVASGVLELRSPRAIRTRAARVLEAGVRGELRHFAVDLARLQDAASFTAEVTQRRYPDLRIPPHSRFGHFDAGGVPRLAALQQALAPRSPIERARALTDVVVTSVLLDAGAGSAWKYRERETGVALGRSEGLAIASLAWAQSGALCRAGTPYEVDAEGLMRVDAASLARAFQVTEDNPLVGLDGRVELLRALGRTLVQRKDVFGAHAPGPAHSNSGDPPRIGAMIDVLRARTLAGVLPADEILALVLDALGGIWPGRLTLDGAPLGDVWRHPHAGGEGVTQGFLPLHKLSQWLSYSLLHPLEVAEIAVRDLDALTGLAEYRNGGLFVDLGVITPRDANATRVAHPVSSELIVEWRALTVALLDRIAPLVRSKLGVNADTLPLAAILEGGTWAAGREIAATLRPNADPPLRVQSDGTVF